MLGSDHSLKYHLMGYTLKNSRDEQLHAKRSHAQINHIFLRSSAIMSTLINEKPTHIFYWGSHLTFDPPILPIKILVWTIN